MKDLRLWAGLWSHSWVNQGRMTHGWHIGQCVPDNSPSPKLFTRRYDCFMTAIELFWDYLFFTSAAYATSSTFFEFLKHGRHAEAMLIMITATYSRVGGHRLALPQGSYTCHRHATWRLPHKLFRGNLMMIHKLAGTTMHEQRVCKVATTGWLNTRHLHSPLTHHHNKAATTLTSSPSRPLNISSKQTI